MLTAIIDLHQGLFAFVAARHAPLVRPPAICQQSRHLSQRHDSTRPAFNRFIERSPRHPIITGKSDQLLDVPVVVVPELVGVRKIMTPPHGHVA